MKKIYLILFIFVFLFCKESVPLWSGKVKLPLIFKGDPPVSGTTENFSMESVAPNKTILIINFFAPGCPPCIDELPDLKTYYLEYKQKFPHVEFITVGSSLTSIDDSDTTDKETVKKDVLNFINEHNLSYPVYAAITKDLKEFNITGYPETFVFYKDKENKWYLRRKFISSVTKKELEEYSNFTEPSSIY
ncbi:MAG: TlpA family protein disulfide reductase [Spirochaetia bacterium]|nr:TlpA family protein disulfide reductase [Spirochaetia bacterium]